MGTTFRLTVRILFLLTVVNPNLAVQCKFKSLNCLSYDTKVIDFSKCFIKAVQRNYNYLTLYAKVMQTARSAMVRIALYKRANGWKPFLYDTTFDGCKFLKNVKANPMANFFYNIIADFTNVNHTCPYNHDMFLEKWRLMNSTVRLPFPKGEYAIDTQWTVNGKPWARINGSWSFIYND